MTSHTRAECPRKGWRSAEQSSAGFKRDVVTVARRGDLTVPAVAVDFGLAEESVRRWVRQADIDDGIEKGQTSNEQYDLVQLRRKMRRLEMENEVLLRAAPTSRRGRSQNDLPVGQ